jgi:uncharacterized tellurite resistance protein B-like protein
MADASVRDLLGGALRPNDPRRFLIEAMIGAMNADGVVDARERAVLDRHIRAHDLFTGLGAPAAEMLIELANDAIRIAGANARAPTIAKGLPARSHRLAAFGMANEVVAADQQVVPGEIEYLETLRVALRISAYEAEQIAHAARIGGLGRFLDDRVLRIKNLIPTAAGLFALRAQAKGMLVDDHRFKVRDFFQAVPDLAMRADELDVELYRAFRRTELGGNTHVYQGLAELARTLPDPVDRYWMIVYALAAEVPATVASWRIIPFIGVLQGAFQVGETDMELAVVDALSFPPALPRPG